MSYSIFACLIVGCKFPRGLIAGGWKGESEFKKETGLDVVTDGRDRGEMVVGKIISRSDLNIRITESPNQETDITCEIESILVAKKMWWPDTRPIKRYLISHSS